MVKNKILYAGLIGLGVYAMSKIFKGENKQEKKINIGEDLTENPTTVRAGQIARGISPQPLPPPIPPQPKPTKNVSVKRIR